MQMYQSQEEAEKRRYITSKEPDPYQKIDDLVKKMKERGVEDLIEKRVNREINKRKSVQAGGNFVI